MEIRIKKISSDGNIENYLVSETNGDGTWFDFAVEYVISEDKFYWNYTPECVNIAENNIRSKHITAVKLKNILQTKTGTKLSVKTIKKGSCKGHFMVQGLKGSFTEEVACIVRDTLAEMNGTNLFGDKITGNDLWVHYAQSHYVRFN